jgi:hypothetical protein
MAPRKRNRTGPKPEVLKIAGNWRDAVKQSLKRGKPPEAKPKKRREKTK